MTKERFDKTLKEEGVSQSQCDIDWEACPFNRDTLEEACIRLAARMAYGGANGKPSRVTG